MKRIIVLFLMLVLSVVLAGCNSYVYKEEDFKFKISVDKTNVKVGETIHVKVTFENVSGQDIKIKMSHAMYSTLKDAISIGVFKSDEEHDFIVPSLGGHLKKTIINQNDITNKELSYEINSLNDYEIQALITFYVGKDYNQEVSIYSDIVKIFVEK